MTYVDYIASSYTLRDILSQKEVYTSQKGSIIIASASRVIIQK